MVLYNQYIKALQESNQISENTYLTFLESSVKRVSEQFQNDPHDPVICEYNEELLNIIDSNFALDPQKTNEFAQKLGEADFYVFCKKRGITLTPLDPIRRTTKRKHQVTPDFIYKPYDIYFEIKTLSVVFGKEGIKKSLEDALDARIEIEQQLKQGRKIASSVYVIQPYGEKPYKRGTITAVIETLLEKTRQNIKRGQFPNDKSFLVINLSLIPPFRTENYVLRPAYCDDYMFKKAVSGDLWMTAFAQPRMLVLGIPEFEGKPCVESVIDKKGILLEFDIIAGILFMVYPWQRDLEVWGLYKYEKHMDWRDNTPEIIEILQKITGNNWNDDRDTNGWQLQGNS